jgi:hypothetical protein
MTTKIARLVPLSGVAFVLTMIGIVALEGDEVPDGATAQEVLAHWADRSDTRLVLTTLAAFAALFLVVFAASLRSTLRSREHAEASASAVAFGGGVIAAAAILISGLVSLSAARAAGDGAIDAVVTLDHLAQSTWLPVTGGLGVMMLASGVGGIHSGALPKLVSWPGVVLGLLLLTPGGLVGFLLSPLWIIAVSVIAYRRTSRFVARTERDTVLTADGSDR